jgi:hypothetical protein
MSKFNAWFTASRRKAIYAASAAITPILVLTGLATDEFAVQALSGVSLVLNAGALVMAIFFVPAAEEAADPGSIDTHEEEPLYLT